MNYAFRPAAPADLPMLRRWLQTPEVVRWWGNPKIEARLLAEDMEDAGMVMLIVSLDGRPFAYVQHYDVGTWPQAHLAHLPNGARGMDAFIGEPALIGRGHGSAFLRLLAERLMGEGATLVAVDPAADNGRAQRAYAKAGFVGEAVNLTEEGPVVVMTFSGASQSAPR